jgi:hypothetical protein
VERADRKSRAKARPPQITMETHMKTLIAALTLGTLIAAPAFIQSANAEYRLDPTRERAIQECMAMQNRDSHDGYEGKKGGGLQWNYQACMANHGQPQ